MLKICRAIGICTAIGEGIEPAIRRTEGMFINPAELLIIQEYAGLRLASYSFQVTLCVTVDQICRRPFQIPGDGY
jgi:hypothetical protein